MKQWSTLPALILLATSLATAQVSLNQNAPNWTVVNKPGDPVDLNWYEGTLSRNTAPTAPATLTIAK